MIVLFALTTMRLILEYIVGFLGFADILYTSVLFTAPGGRLGSWVSFITGIKVIFLLSKFVVAAAFPIQYHGTHFSSSILADVIMVRFDKVAAIFKNRLIALRFIAAT